MRERDSVQLADTKIFCRDVTHVHALVLWFVPYPALLGAPNIHITLAHTLHKLVHKHTHTHLHVTQENIPRLMTKTSGGMTSFSLIFFPFLLFSIHADINHSLLKWSWALLYFTLVCLIFGKVDPQLQIFHCFVILGLLWRSKWQNPRATPDFWGASSHQAKTAFWEMEMRTVWPTRCQTDASSLFHCFCFVLCHFCKD